MMMINLSDGFINKFVKDKFVEINRAKWTERYVRWLIDSKYRITSRLDKFISDQVNNPPPPLLLMIKEQNFIDRNPDKTMLNILRYVVLDYQYSTDYKAFGYAEKWRQVMSTIETKKGDCEDLNSLIHIIALLCETIPEVCLWSCIGMTNAGGHYWLLYMSPKTGKFYQIDATFRPDLTEIKNGRMPFELNEFIPEIWYMFNNLRCYKYDK